MISEIDLYINTLPKNVQEKLLELHQYIRILIPEAEEVIAYKMPAFKQNKILVITQDIKIISGFIQQHRVLKILSMNLLDLSIQKEQFNSL